MSADLLRRAATALRDAADKATPGPWEAAGREVDRASGDYASVLSRDVDCGSYCQGGTASTPSHDDAAYIALVNPTVGLALADWLDGVVAAIEAGDPDDLLGFGEPSAARAVARAILGEQP